jgi:DNA-binding CsgD family transcriptional regulator
VKAALAQGNRFDPDASFVFVPPGLQKSTLGEFHGLLAVAAAARGESDSARDHTKQARRLTNGVDARCYAACADLIAAAPERRADDARAVVRTCLDRGFAHGLVVAYRAHPPLLRAFAAEPEAAAEVARVLRRAGDVRLASRIGFPGTAFADTSDLLTPREDEILGLLTNGLTNAEIAQRLVISESTVKVHVHHILRKLGVRTRLEAALRKEQPEAQDG